MIPHLDKKKSGCTFIIDGYDGRDHLYHARYVKFMDELYPPNIWDGRFWDLSRGFTFRDPYDLPLVLTDTEVKSILLLGKYL